ncbi:microtubule cross-linking factor 1-like isoform X1 [Anguilla rostrata]|uniref:microtubule cross-linking factor 1-like isoform X1 n=1 Tax=Anguilla rostrata TaxID=7938 RepID=UPI0030CB5FF5
MESSHGSTSETKQQNHQLEKKRLNRAPSPARPFIKDIHSRSSKPPAIAPKSPKLTSKQQPSVGLLATQSRLSRRAAPAAKDKTAPLKSTTKPTVTKKGVKLTQHGTSEQKVISKQGDSSQNITKGKKVKISHLVHGSFGHGSPIRVPTGGSLGRISHTDSSSDLSDCPSEPLSDEQRLAQAASSDAESGSGSGSSDRDQQAVDNPLPGASSSETPEGAHVSPRTGELCTASSGVAKERLSHGLPLQKKCITVELTDRLKLGLKSENQKAPLQHTPESSKELIEEDLLREIEDLRSENDYLKDEVDELRAEMEEVRDSYLEEEVYQVQELRRELDRANKNCRILQYRLRKAEQRSLRVAQTGRVDGELLRNLEQDLKVAKDVSVRLHNELDSVEDKRSRAEDENELLRQKIIEVEVSKQALHNELERVREGTLRRRASREMFKEKKSAAQEDSADLRCQLQFAKEESALMRKKMAKLGREKDELEQELQKYRSVYGDVDSPLAPAECGGGPHTTREAELKLRLKLVEEEANILGRKMVELEVENRGLRAENEDLRCHYEEICLGREPLTCPPASPYGDALESGAELRRHLQFVEEEAELLRRSISEIEDHNKELTSELNRFKFGVRPEDDGAPRPVGGNGAGNGGACGANVGGLPLQEELKAARLQINDLSGKVLKLQYENRVLISNVQRCDLASQLGPRAASPRDRDSDAESDKRESEDEAPPPPQPKREGPVGGESDSEDLLERTSGFSSGKPSELSRLSPMEPPQRRRDDGETFANVRREAERLGRTVDRLITDTDGLVHDGRLLATAGEPPGADSRGDGGSADGRSEPRVFDAINTRMRAFRTELHIFMEKVEHLGEGLRDRGDDLSPMPHLTESSSFLSGVTSMSRDSPIGTLGRDGVTDFQLRDTPVSEASTPAREVQARLEQERRCRQEEQEVYPGLIVQQQEEERRDGDLGRSLDQAWTQERPMLQQELRLLRHSTVVFYVKLRSLLAHWRLGRRADAAVEGALPECETLENPELGLVAEQAEGGVERGAERGEQPCLQHGVGDASSPGYPTHALEVLPPQTQVSDSRRVLHALRGLLEELRSELREEEHRRCHLQRTYASERAAFELQLAELKSHADQLKEARGEEVPGEDLELANLTGAFQREREEHQRLLAESHSTALDLRWKLQHGEKRWSRERAELLERFDRERQDWDWHLRELHRKMERLQRELNTRRGEGSPEVKDGGHRAFSPQDSPRTPRSPRSPCIAAPAPLSARSHSDSDAPLEGRPAMVRVKGAESSRPEESLFLDALSLDPLSESEVPPLSRVEKDKRFPGLKEVLNEKSDRKSPIAYHEEEMTSGNLLRAKSVCSMSEFQRLMDSSPFLPDRTTHGDDGRRDEVTPPLSPDDLKYIEEFNSKGWDFQSGQSLGSAAEAWPEVQRPEQAADAFQPASWYLTTSATLTTNTMSSPEPCQRPTSRNGGGADRYAVRVLHSPPHSLKLDPPSLPAGAERPGAETEFMFSMTKAKVGDTVGGADDVFGRWPCDLLEAGLRPIDRPVCSAVGFASSLELELSRNLSDDMKEVAFSVRNAIRSSPVDRQLRDSASQTNTFTTRGTQTTQTISVGLQTEALRNITSSPHRCLTPKGGSTPISSPSRSLRKMQYSPVIQTKFERPCCSPKYGSPKLQRKPPTPAKVDQSNSRAPTPTTPQKGYSESAWARSTTTRDSPVHTTINDGLSSLFNIIDHSPVVYDALQKFTKSPSRSRPAEASSAEPRSTGFGVVQEFLKNVRGRSPSPVQLIVETQGDKNAEVISIRQDLSAPPGYTLAENTARILNKRLMEQDAEEERRTPSGSQTGQAKEGRPNEGEKGAMEELPRSPVAPPLDSCFLRPARPANQRPPSRWAARSPSSSPHWSQKPEKKFHFPLMEPSQVLPEAEEPGQGQ